MFAFFAVFNFPFYFNLFFSLTNHFYYSYFLVCVLCIRDFGAFFVEIFFPSIQKTNQFTITKDYADRQTKNCTRLLLFNFLISILFGFLSVTWVLLCSLFLFILYLAPGNDFNIHFDFRHFIDKNFVFWT